MKKYSIPTNYKGTKFRSRLEANTAQAFDRLKIKWVFEPQSFLLESGIHYWPDFWLPELKTWVECKGYLTKEEHETHKEFMTQQLKENKDILFVLISTQHIDVFEKGDGPLRWVEGIDDFSQPEMEPVILHKCFKCKKYYFSTDIGDFGCKACGEHNGDHNTVEYIFSSKDFFEYAGVNKE